MLDQGNSVSKGIIEMVGDLESRGYSVSYNTIEIGSLGHYTNLTLKALCNFASKSLTKSECSKLLNNVAKISISCSHTIFLARESCEWDTSRRLFTL